MNWNLTRLLSSDHPKVRHRRQGDRPRLLTAPGKGSLKSYQRHKPLSPSAQLVIEEAI